MTRFGEAATSDLKSRRIYPLIAWGLIAVGWRSLLGLCSHPHPSCSWLDAFTPSLLVDRICCIPHFARELREITARAITMLREAFKKKRVSSQNIGCELSYINKSRIERDGVWELMMVSWRWRPATV